MMRSLITAIGNRYLYRSRTSATHTAAAKHEYVESITVEIIDRLKISDGLAVETKRTKITQNKSGRL